MIAEVALALVLLIGASLFVRSFLNLQSASPGFNTAPLLTLRFFMTGEAYANPEQRQQRVADIVRRIEGLPGMESVYASNFIPLGGGGGSAIVDGRAVAKGEEPNILFIGVTPTADAIGDRFRLAGTEPVEWFTVIGVAAFLTAIAFVASYLPARRATNVDPIVALRNE